MRLVRGTGVVWLAVVLAAAQGASQVGGAAQTTPLTPAGAATTPARAAGQGGGQGGRGFGAAIGFPVLGMPFVHDPSTVVHDGARGVVYFIAGWGDVDAAG